MTGRRNFIYASSTCGLKFPERYCILGVNTDPTVNLNATTSCRICDSTRDFDNAPENHRIEKVINNNDNSKRWWQSENNKDNVFIQFDLENEFLFSHIYIKFKTNRPEIFTIEKSSDFGLTWSTFSYYATNCKKTFPEVQIQKYRKSNSFGVPTCKEMDLSKNQVKARNLHYHIMDSIIPKNLELFSPESLNILKVTNLKFNFLKLHRLGDEELHERYSEQNEKYYYSIYQMAIHGTCLCYGHANKCKKDEDPTGYDMVEIDLMTHAGCECKHNTDGLNCEKCLPLYNDKPWAPATLENPNICKKCECNGHAEECDFDKNEYEKSGGVSGGFCRCLHNTEGRHCDKCKVGFWHDPKIEFTKHDACKG